MNSSQPNVALVPAVAGFSAGFPVLPEDDGGTLQQLIREFFEPESYLWLHEDVKQVFHHAGPDVFFHFVEYGRQEGRSPSLFFDVSYVADYLSRIEGETFAHAEVMAAFAALPPSRRFVPNRWFSAWAFAARYKKTLRKFRGLSDYDLFIYYLRHCRETALSPSGLFNEERYRELNPDVAQLIADGKVPSGFFHYIMKGQHEGRINIPGYGHAVAEPPPAQSAVVLAHGGDTRALLWFFDEEFYLSAYDDVHALKRAGRIRSGLEHFIVVGCAEGRLPHPNPAMSPLGEGARDGWSFLSQMADRMPPASRKISFKMACDARDKIAGHPGVAGRRQVTDAIWPFVETPEVRSKVDIDPYIAVNTDIAALAAQNRQAAQDHWVRYGFAEGRAAPGTNFFGGRKPGLRAFLDWRQGVNFFGPMSSKSGLGHAARGYLAALQAAGVPVEVHDVSALLNLSLPADFFHADGLAYSINFFFLNADQVIPFVRRYGSSVFENRANIAAWVWELPSPRPEWRDTLGAFDLIIVPSAFTARSFSLFTDVPIKVVPYVIDAGALRRAAVRPQPDHWSVRLQGLKAEGKRIILFIMDASSYSARKGLDLFERLAAHFHATAPDKYVFVLKTHSRDYSMDVFKPKVSGNLIVIESLMEFGDLCHLKTLADVYVSPHRSEGFGLNIFESILLGVPALCSDYGGPLDMLGPEYPHLIPGRLTEIGREMGPYRAGAVWFEPDFDVLCAKLAAMEKPDAATDALAERLASALSAAAVGGLMLEVLSAYCGYRQGEAAGDGSGQLDGFARLAAARNEECLRFASPSKLLTGGENRFGHLSSVLTGMGKPVFSVITTTYNTEPGWLRALYEDMINQTFPHWEWCISDDASTRADTIETLRELRRSDARIQVRFGDTNLGISENTNRAVEIATGKYIVMVDHDDRISTDLLHRYKTWLGTETAGVMLYCDEDKVDEAGIHSETYYKPDWSYDHLMSCMYILHCLCVTKALFLQLGGYRAEFSGAQDHDFSLRVAAGGTPIVHVDERLYHWRKTPGSASVSADAKSYAAERGRLAVQEHMRRIGLSGHVEHGHIPGTYRVRPRLPGDTVCVNILTGCTPIPGAADGKTYVEALVCSILEHHPKPDFMLRVVVEADRMSRIAHLNKLSPRVRVEPYTGGSTSFNFAEKANYAVRTSPGERVVLLNDDMLALDDGWLEALLEMLEVPGVGLVGGKLLRPNGNIQHAGIALGVLGISAHLFENTSKDDFGYNVFPHVIRNYSAVTGAMLALRQSAFHLVGGFDESFPVDYNDVDFCLKIGEAGLRVVFTPYAKMIHFESRSAKRLVADSLDARRFARKWDHKIRRDPYYNVNLTRNGVCCEDAVPVN